MRANAAYYKMRLEERTKVLLGLEAERDGYSRALQVLKGEIKADEAKLPARINRVLSDCLHTAHATASAGNAQSQRCGRRDFVWSLSTSPLLSPMSGCLRRNARRTHRVMQWYHRVTSGSTRATGWNNVNGGATTSPPRALRA
jgi:hypothetical protein